jgi:hypothetical protein
MQNSKKRKRRKKSFCHFFSFLNLNEGFFKNRTDKLCILEKTNFHFSFDLWNGFTFLKNCHLNCFSNVTYFCMDFKYLFKKTVENINDSCFCFGSVLFENIVEKLRRMPVRVFYFNNYLYSRYMIKAC